MARAVKIYTRKGDDGTTGLLYGGRVRKDSLAIEVNGAVDEAQAALGLARAETEPGSELDSTLIALERDLWVLMAEVATAPRNRAKLVPESTLVTASMVGSLEARIDAISERVEMPEAFVVPGESRTAAALDLARTIVRRAERLAVGLELPGSEVLAYLNRLSDLCWILARAAEGRHLLASEAGAHPRGPVMTELLALAEAEEGAEAVGVGVFDDLSTESKAVSFDGE